MLDAAWFLNLCFWTKASCLVFVTFSWMRPWWRGCGVWRRCSLTPSAPLLRSLHNAPSHWPSSFTGTSPDKPLYSRNVQCVRESSGSTDYTANSWVWSQQQLFTTERIIATNWCKSQLVSKIHNSPVCYLVSVFLARRSGSALPPSWSWYFLLCLRRKDYS